MSKVYVSPSTQENNRGVGDFGTEEYRMNLVADFLVPLLKVHGHQVKRNRPGMTLNQVVADSNAWGADIHVALHSNAGGGQGTEAWYYTGSDKGKRLAECLYREIAPLSPGDDRGVKYKKGYYELDKTNAPAVIAEVGFHDWAPDAAWIVSKPLTIAVACYRSICRYFGEEARDYGGTQDLMLENSRMRAKMEEMRADLKRICGIAAPYEIN